MNKIWKILKIILIVIVCLIVVGLIGAYIFLKNFDIKKYKPQIISAAHQAVGRDVNFDDIDLQVSLKEGIRFNLKNLTISENPDFGQESFLKVSDVSVGVDILSFVNARQISVPNILIRSPQVTIIRQASGKLNVETIGPSTPTAAQPAQGSSTPGAAALPAIFINSLRIEDAQLKFIDQSMSPQLEVSVSQLNVGVDHFSLMSPFSFFVEAAVLSSQKNFKIDGTVQLNLRKNEVRLNNVQVTSDLGQWSLDEVRRLPMLKGVPIPQVLEGQYSGTIKECVASDKGLSKLVVDTKLSGGRVVINEVAPGISVDLSHIDLSVSDFSMDQPFKVSLKAGYLSDIPNIDFQGTIAMDMKTQGIHLSNTSLATDLSLWPLEKMKASLAPLKDVPLPEKIAGQIQVVVKDLVAGPKGLDSALLDAKWQNGEVVLEKAVPGISVNLTKTNFAVENFSLNAPFKVSLRTAFLNDTENISLDGIVNFDQKTQAIDLKDTTIAVDLDALSLEKLKASVLALKDVPLPQILGGKFTTTLKNLNAGPKGLESVLADVNWNQGKIVMKDAAPGISINAQQIDLAVKNFSLTDPFQVSTKAAYLADSQNISFDGMVSYNMQTQDVHLKDSVFAVDLAKLDFQELKSNVLPLKDVPLPQNLSGNLSVRLKDFAAGPKGLGTVLVDVDLKEGAVSMKDAAPGISFDASHIDLGVTDFSLGGSPFGFHVKAAYLNDEPNIDLNGTAILDLSTQSVKLKDTALDVDLSKFSIDKLRASVLALKDVPMPQNLAGNLNVRLKDLAAGPKGLGAVLLDADLKDGAVSMKDVAPGISFNASHIDLGLTNFSLGSPFGFHLKAAYLDDEPNIDLGGTASFDLLNQSVQLTDTTFKTDLSRFSMDELRASVLSLKDVPFPESLGGQLSVVVKEAVGGPKGLVSLTTHGDLKESVIKFKELNVPVKIIDTSFDVTGSKAVINTLTANIGKGVIKLNASVDNYLTSQDFQFDASIDDIDLVEILNQNVAPIKAEGKITGVFKAQGRAADLNTITGSGNLDVKDGKLIDFNVLKTVFDSIKVPLLPNLSELVMGVLPEEYKKQFNSKDTNIQKAHFVMTIDAGNAQIDPIDVQSDLFLFLGKGSAGFDQSYAFDGGFKLSKDLSDLLARDVEQPFAYMLDENNYVSFPVHVKGKGNQAPVVEVTSTFTDITKNVIRNKGKEELGKVLGNVLGGGSGQASGQAGDSQGEGGKSPEQQVVDSIFGTIFK